MLLWPFYALFYLLYSVCLILVLYIYTTLIRFFRLSFWSVYKIIVLNRWNLLFYAYYLQDEILKSTCQNVRRCIGRICQGKFTQLKILYSWFIIYMCRFAAILNVCIHEVVYIFIVLLKYSCSHLEVVVKDFCITFGSILEALINTWLLLKFLILSCSKFLASSCSSRSFMFMKI